MSVERFSEIYEYRLQVAEDVIDEMEHVGNLHYLQWTNRAAVAHCRSLGWSSDRFRELGKAFWCDRTKFNIEFQPYLATPS